MKNWFLPTSICIVIILLGALGWRFAQAPSVSANTSISNAVVIEHDLDPITFTQSVSEGYLFPGDEVKYTYTIDVPANGPSGIYVPTLLNALPDVLEYVSHSIYPESEATHVEYVPEKDAFYLENKLASNTDLTLSVVGFVPNDIEEGSIVSHTVTVDYEGVSEGNENNVSYGTSLQTTTAVAVLPSVPEISLIIQSDKQSVFAGDEVLFTLTVNNYGEKAVVPSEVSVLDRLPSELSYIEHRFVEEDKGAGTYNPETGVWDISDLPPGSSTTMYLSASVQDAWDGSDIQNEVFLTHSYQIDGVLTDFDITDEGTITLIEQDPVEDDGTVLMPQLSFTKQTATTEARVSDTVTFFMELALDDGLAGAAFDIEISDELPEGITYAAHRQYTYVEGGVIASNRFEYSQREMKWRGRMSSGERYVLEIDVLVDEGTQGSVIENIAYVSFDGKETRGSASFSVQEDEPTIPDEDLDPIDDDTEGETEEEEDDEVVTESSTSSSVSSDAPAGGTVSGGAVYTRRSFQKYRAEAQERTSTMGVGGGAGLTDLNYVVYIANPDGSIRTSGSSYAQTEERGQSLGTVHFEDKGIDFDYNDIAVSYNTRSCSHAEFYISELNAGWHHMVGVKVYKGDTMVGDVILFENSHAAERMARWIDLGQFINNDCAQATLRTSGDALCYEGGCKNAEFYVYIVNPDGTIRYTNSAFNLVERLESRLFNLRFEDKGADMDFNDLKLTLDMRDCANIQVTLDEVNAGWQHEIRGRLYLHGVDVWDTVLWQNSHDGIGETYQFDVADHVTMCSE